MGMHVYQQPNKIQIDRLLVFRTLTQAFRKAMKTCSQRKSVGKKSVDEREEYRILRRIVRPGDELVIDALDRLGRTKQIVKEEVEYFKKRGVALRVLSLPTTLTDMGESTWVMDMVNNIIIEVYSSLAEEELIIKERRQRAGIEAAKKKGMYKGRKPKQIDWARFEELYNRWTEGAIKTKEFKALMNLSTSTFYRVVDEFKSGTMESLQHSKRSQQARSKSREEHREQMGKTQMKKLSVRMHTCIFQCLQVVLIE